MVELGRILLAEDDPNDVELIVRALGKNNLANDVVVTRDGSEALDYLYRRGLFAGRPPGHPVVVLLDLKMPKVNGVQVIRELKADAAMRAVPIVVLTSSRESRDLEECYQLGVNAYVVKPVVFAEFVDAVRQVGAFWALINEPPPGSARKPMGEIPGVPGR